MSSHHPYSHPVLVQAGPREQRSSRALVWLVAPVHHDRFDLPIRRFEQARTRAAPSKRLVDAVEAGQAPNTGGLATDAANSKSHFERAASSLAFMPDQGL